MTDNFGTGVSRVLDPKQTGFVGPIFQEGKPPLDAELSLLDQIAEENTRQLALKGTPSGWYGDAVNPQDSYVTNAGWSNWFRFGPQLNNEKQAILWANVNGWTIPVTGTLTGAPPGSPNNTDTWNRIALSPPPANTGDSRIDFVFLEVWKAKLAPNPSTTNKPGSSAIYRFGNVEGGYTFITDDLQDPEIGFETTQRVQLQYRIRVVSGLVGLASYPDGFDPTVVKGQGAAGSPTAYIFENMRKELGDPGLWRAGDGTLNALGTVDGYTYAIPICAVFRRNSVAWDVSNINGSVNRNPTAVDRTGYKTFSTIPTLAADISATATTLTLNSVANIPLPLSPASPLLIQIGDEILAYTAITGTTVSGLFRGQNGSLAEVHKAGSVVRVLSIRPDGLFADQITSDDILDLRHLVNSGGFDYRALLQTNLDKLLRGKLNSTWKRAGNSSQGPRVNFVDYISASSGPLGTERLLDSPDGIRQVWCDPCVLQPVVIPVKYPSSVGTAVVIGGTLGNSFGSVTINHSGSAGFQIGDVITIPKSLFTASVPGTDVDQVRIIATTSYVKVRFFGETTDLATPQYTVADVGGDLQITLTASFSTRSAGAYITVYVMYGAGRGLNHRPDFVHSVMYLASSPNIAVQLQGAPTGDRGLRATWLSLWSQYQSAITNSCVPSTAECHIDSGSKSIALTPYRLLTFSVTDTNSQLKTIQKAHSTQDGAMPFVSLLGAPKWNGTSDPLNLFSGCTDPTTSRADMVVILPRPIIPGYGEIRAPILYQDSGNFAQGINLLVNAPKGAGLGASVSTYVPMANGSVSYAIFSTQNLNTSTPATWNAAFTWTAPIAGMRFFTDSRGLGRRGLELPPFYFPVRLWAIYSAQDYKTNGSSFNSSTRVPDASGATNLLRQNFDGPAMWVEIDDDGDSTVIINADIIDIARSPDGLTSFETSDFIIEASIAGVDRGFFVLSDDPRLVLTRDRGEGLTSGTVVTHPSLILPFAPEVGDQIAVSYSKYAYQGDCYNSQLLASEPGAKYGVMTTASRYLLMTTGLTYAALTRPNQKPLEVLASTAFSTTLGTGRFSGSISSSATDVRNVGYENWIVPVSSITPRAIPNPVALVTAEKAIPLSSEYVGLTCHLPLGALFRDKDFRGNAVGGATGDLRQLVLENYTPGILPSSLSTGTSDYAYLGAISSTGSNSGVVVQVDGNGDSYNVLTNYRTNRGGSAFSGSGFVGGDIGAILPSSTSSSTFGGILSGIALLVRNLPTNVGAQEVSAGQELCMLVITTSRAQSSSGTINSVQCGTAGTGESYSAADLYRVCGHPLTNDPSRYTGDPATIVLARKADLIS